MYNVTATTEKKLQIGTQAQIKIMFEQIHGVTQIHLPQ